MRKNNVLDVFTKFYSIGLLAIVLILVIALLQYFTNVVLIEFPALIFMFILFLGILKLSKKSICEITCTKNNSYH